MPSRNDPCPCGSRQKYKRCGLGEARRSAGHGLASTRRPQRTGIDEVTAEAAVLAEEVMMSPNRFQQASHGLILLRELFREGGPLASLRWSWDELVPVVERHIFRVTEEVEDMEERRERLFDRCAPELLDLERVERFDQGLRQALMSPGRTLEEWAYRVLVVRPLAVYGAFAKAREAPLRERFEGEAVLVGELQRRERWRAEDLEPYRLRLAARDAHGAEQRVRRLQALLRGEEPAPGSRSKG